MTDQETLDMEAIARVRTYKRHATGPSDKFVSKGGQNLIHEKWEPSPEQVKEAEAHFAELEKEWGVKFKPWNPDD